MSVDVTAGEVRGECGSYIARISLYQGGGGGGGYCISL